MALYHYYPRFPRPKILLSVRAVPTREMAVVLQTLAGLVARQALHARIEEMVWVPPPQPAYGRWLRMMLEHTRASLQADHDIWELVERYRERNTVKGYVLYSLERSTRRVGEVSPDMDISLNVATSLCSVLEAVAVDESLKSEAEAHGLRLLEDARTLSEEECYARHGDHFSQRVMAIQDPKIIETRAEMVAMEAFVASRPNALYERVLQHLQPDSPVIGWGTGDESEFTLPSTEWGHFQTATTYCFNLPVLSSAYAGHSLPVDRLRLSREPSIWQVDWRDDVNYVAFLMSDGDNVSWMLSNFIEDAQRSWWSNPARGAFPMGWTFPYTDLVQLCPYALQYLLRTTTQNDDLILMGGGYYYPDHFGRKRGNPSALLKTHAQRIAEYMRIGALRTIAVNTQRWDSRDALRAYRIFAHTLPDLLGIFALQYYPYPAGRGKVLWVDSARGDPIPVVSARYAIWNNARRDNEGTPSMVARWLNDLPTQRQETRFSWVSVHCWSWFRKRASDEPPEAEDIEQSEPLRHERGLSPVQWCVHQLQPHIQTVTPTQLLWLMHLHHHPAHILRKELGQLAERCRSLNTRNARLANELSRQLQSARRRLQDGDYRTAFNLGRAVYQKLSQTSSR